MEHSFIDRNPTKRVAYCCTRFEDKFMGPPTVSSTQTRRPSSFLSNLNPTTCLPALFNLPHIILMGAAHIHNRIMRSEVPILLKIVAITLLAGATAVVTGVCAVISGIALLALSILSTPYLLLPKDCPFYPVPKALFAMSISSLIAMKHLFLLIRDMFVKKGDLDPSDAMNKDSYALHDRFIVSSSYHFNHFDSVAIAIVEKAEARWKKDGAMPSFIRAEKSEALRNRQRITEQFARRQFIKGINRAFDEADRNTTW